MDKIFIEGGVPLKGEIRISGAKNAALPLMTCCLLTDETLRLSNLPHLMDISTMVNLLASHGVDFKLDGIASDSGHVGEVVLLNAANITNFEASYDIVRKMRASVLVLGPLLARFGQARVSLPGGCAIGTRPIDLHLDALEKMGAIIELEGGYINAHTKGLKGADITFDKVSVGATENLLMAATLAEGTTILRNAAREPEIGDLVNCLLKMGAEIEGIGTSTLTIKGKKSLRGADYSVIPDRIEAGTYMVAAAMTDGDLLLKGVSTNILGSVIEKLNEAGVSVAETPEGLRVRRKGKSIKSVNITTEPYPGFPTDMQAQFMTLMTIADGESIINENIFENRFMHVAELHRLGADIKIDGHTAIVHGVSSLKGAQVMATDLRASVSLVLAALVAEGQTTLGRVYHIDRGYERVEEKLSRVGAKMIRSK
jgi:UDP-N-acetylglucosamine 1-carboxyvinyltransferase